MKRIMPTLTALLIAAGASAGTTNGIRQIEYSTIHPHSSSISVYGMLAVSRGDDRVTGVFGADTRKDDGIDMVESSSHDGKETKSCTPKTKAELEERIEGMSADDRSYHGTMITRYSTNMPVNAAERLTEMRDAVTNSLVDVAEYLAGQKNARYAEGSKIVTDSIVMRRYADDNDNGTIYVDAEGFRLIVKRKEILIEAMGDSGSEKNYDLSMHLDYDNQENRVHADIVPRFETPGMKSAAERLAEQAWETYDRLKEEIDVNNTMMRVLE